MWVHLWVCLHTSSHSFTRVWFTLIKRERTCWGWGKLLHWLKYQTKVLLIHIWQATCHVLRLRWSWFDIYTIWDFHSISTLSHVRWEWVKHVKKLFGENVEIKPNSTYRAGDEFYVHIVVFFLLSQITNLHCFH